MVVEVEPQRPQDAMLMDFLTAPAENTEQNTYSSDNAPLQIISLDLPPLEFVPPPEEENSPLDLSLITPEEETIEAATVPDNAEEVFEEIDLVELDIELQPPLSFFEPHKK
jgi:pilus assembly protein FimV